MTEQATHPPGVAPVRRLQVTAMLVVLASCSSLLGLVRDQSIARFFGTSAQTDAFLVAWTVPETATPLLMEGALALLLVPVFTRALAAEGSVQRVVQATFASFGLALLALTGLVVAAAPVLVHLFAPGLADPALAVRCLRVAASTVVSLGIAGYLMAVLRATGTYVLTMSVYSAFNIGILAMVLLLHRSQGVYAAALGLAVGGGLTVAVQIGAFLRRSSLRRLRWLSPRIAALALAGILPVATYTVGRQAQVYVERYYGSGLHPGAISALSYAERIAQIPVQAATMLAVVSFPLLAKHAATGRIGELRRAAQRDLRMVAFLVVPAVGLFVALAPQIVSVLFERGAFGQHEVATTASALRVYSLGLPGQALVGVGAICVSSMPRSGWSLPRAALAGLMVTVLADAVLVHPLGINGLALGNAVGITVMAGVLIVVLRRRMIGFALAPLAGWMLRCAAAGASAGLAGHVAGRFVGRLPLSSAGTVAVVGVVVAAGYLAAARLVGLDEASQTWSLLRVVGRRIVAAARRRPAGGPSVRRRLRAGHLVFLGAAVTAGGYLGVLVAAVTPTRFTAVEFLLVTPPPGRHQSASETRYTSGVQRLVTEVTSTRTEPGVRIVVSPEMPLIEIDATAGSSDAAVARAGAAAIVAEQAWRQRSGAADARLRRVLPTAVSARRTAPSPAIDGIVGAVLGATAATVVAATRSSRPALSTVGPADVARPS